MFVYASNGRTFCRNKTFSFGTFVLFGRTPLCFRAQNAFLLHTAVDLADTFIMTRFAILKPKTAEFADAFFYVAIFLFILPDCFLLILSA